MRVLEEERGHRSEDLEGGEKVHKGHHPWQMFSLNNTPYHTEREGDSRTQRVSHVKLCAAKRTLFCHPVATFEGLACCKSNSKKKPKQPINYVLFDFKGLKKTLKVPFNRILHSQQNLPMDMNKAHTIMFSRKLEQR